MTKEDFDNVVNSIRETIGEETSALISEDLLKLISGFTEKVSEYDKKVAEVNKLQNEKDELLKVNGQLFQKIGFENKETKEKDLLEDEKEDEVINIEDIIDEKGEFINE